MKSNSKTVKTKKSTKKQTLKGGWVQHGSNAMFPTGTTSVTTHNNIRTSGATSNAKPIDHIEINSDLPMNKPIPPYIPPKQPEPENPQRGLGYIEPNKPNPINPKDVPVISGKTDKRVPSASQGDAKPYRPFVSGYIEPNKPNPINPKDVPVISGKTDKRVPSASQGDAKPYITTRKRNDNDLVGWAIKDVNSLNGKKTSKKSTRIVKKHDTLGFLENSVRNMF